MIKDVSIIIPFLNERENLPVLCINLDNYLQINKFSCEVIFVDDGSTDDSLEIIKDYNAVNFSIKIIKLSKNFGSHAALRAGILNATGHYITFYYTDMQDPIDIIEKLYIECSKGNEIVWAERAEVDNPFFVTVFSSVYAKLMKKYVSPHYPLKGFDILMFSEKVQKVINQNIESNSSVFLQILTSGFKQDKIQYVKSKRKFGKSKWTLAKKIKLFIDSFVAFSYMPIRLVSIMGILFFIFGMIWTLYVVGRTLIYHDLNQGWPALISVLLVGFGVTNIALGIIAEYLWRTFDAARKRPVFIIDEIINISNK